MDSNQVGLFSIYEIFENRIFRIPDYQRGYSWKTEHVEALWEDLFNLEEKDNQVHYTGMITVQSPIESDILKWQKELKHQEIHISSSEITIASHPSYRPLYIADGQQRLTTIVLLLAAFRDSGRFVMDNQLESKFLLTSMNDFQLCVFGYEIDSPSHEFLYKRIFLKSNEALEQGETNYTENIKSAKLFFDEKLKLIDTLKLDRLYFNLVHNLKFNYYELPTHLNIFTVFETMNLRGKPLSTLELLKNRLIYLSTILPGVDQEQKDRLRIKINESWIRVYQILARNKGKILADDDYLRIHWLLYFNHDTDGAKELQQFKRSLLEEIFIKRNLFPESDGKVEITYTYIENYVESIANCAPYYFEIKNPNHETSTQSDPVKYWLTKINRQYPKSYFEPIILGALSKQEDENIVVRLLINIERYIFLVFGIGELRSNANKTPFLIDANKYFMRNKDLNIIIKKLKPEFKGKDTTLKSREPAVKIESIDVLFDTFLKNRQKDRSDEGFLCWKFLKYFMSEYEEYVQKKRTDIETYIVEKNSLDLIFPPYKELPRRDKKQLSSCKQFNEKRATNWSHCIIGFGKETGQMYLCYTLGNIVLTANDKREDSPDTFEEKKIRYKDGSCSEKEISEAEGWGPEKILERGINLLVFMEGRWSITIDYNLKKQILYLNQSNIDDSNIAIRMYNAQVNSLFDEEPKTSDILPE